VWTNEENLCTTIVKHRTNVTNDRLVLTASPDLLVGSLKTSARIRTKRNEWALMENSSKRGLY
jgi:hypothetical protein